MGDDLVARFELSPELSTRGDLEHRGMALFILDNDRGGKHLHHFAFDLALLRDVQHGKCRWHDYRDDAWDEVVEPHGDSPLVGDPPLKEMNNRIEAGQQ